MAAAAAFVERKDLYIGGKWVPSQSRDTIEVIGASTEEPLGRVPDASKADIDRAVAAARNAFDKGPFPDWSPAERADAITRLRHFFGWLAEGDRRTFINFPAIWAFAARWSPKIERIAEQVTAELLAPARMAIDTGIATGQLRNVDPAAACEMLWNAYLAGMRRASVHDGKPADALAHVERAIGLIKA